MIHRNRVWCLDWVETPEELAEKLTQVTWTGCTAFAVAGHEKYVFLNDATSGDGAQEYGIVKRMADGQTIQVESITFSWTTEANALRMIRDALAGRYDGHDFAHEVIVAIESPEEHERCHLCA